MRMVILATPCITERLVGFVGRRAVPPREPGEASKGSGDGGDIDK